jgi:purine-binding chemotaxis protein CheW
MNGNKLVDDYLSELMGDDDTTDPGAPIESTRIESTPAVPLPHATATEPAGVADIESTDAAEPGGTAHSADSDAAATPALPPPSPDLPQPDATDPDPLAAFRDGGRNISDDEFEAMLDVLQGKPAAPSAAPPASSAASTPPVPPDLPVPPATSAAAADDPLAAFRTGSRDIADDEFEAMLDVLQGKAEPPPVAAAGLPGTDPAPTAPPPAPPAVPPIVPATLPASRRSPPVAAPTFIDTLPARQAEQLLPQGSAVSPLTSGPDQRAERHRRAEERISSWLRFSLGKQSFAVEVLKVQEVLRLSTILPVRGTEAAMLGVMNLRGQIVPVLDLALKLGFPTAPPSEASRIIVLEEGGETLGLQVASVADVTNVSDARIEKISGTPSLVAADVVRGVARREGNIIIMLDASRLLA